MKCKCTKGKLLPAFPSPKLKKLPDCVLCDGTGFVEVNESMKAIAQAYKQRRIAMGITSRKFCMEFDIDPVTLYKYEEGVLKETPREIIIGYGWLLTNNA